MKKKVCIVAFSVLTGIQTLYAQNQAQLDSITNANKQLQLQNDSLKQVQQQTVKAASSAPKNKDTRPVIKRFSLDLSTSFWINPSNIYFEFSPTLMYHFPKTFGIGAGPAYIHREDVINDVGINGWGAKVFGKANFTRWFYAWTEYQGINSQHIAGIDQSGTVTKDHDYVDSWFLSMVINLRIGKRHGINLQSLYDVFV